ncbi:MAG: D-glycero-beta-D-manno-heptose-7-phosphate kinase [Ignavibacteriales bacterium]
MKVEMLSKIKEETILVFGDYMVDKYIDGNVSRISPEAPVPVVEVNSKMSRLGGAGNVINNIITLGAKVRPIGCVGEDEDGTFFINNLYEAGVDTQFLKKCKNAKTIIKTRIVSKNQQFLRLDEEIIMEMPEEYKKFILSNLKEIFDGIDSFVISDYGKGAVSKDIAQIMIKHANENNIPIIVDPKGKDYSKYNHATILTPNVKELGIVSNNKFDSEDSIFDAGLKLCEDTHLKYLALTRSEKGISLFDYSKHSKIDFPTFAKDVIDVTGAGDTVVSIFAILLPLAFEIGEICQVANSAASVVISKFGASTVSLNELLSSIYNTGDFKLISNETAKYIIDDLKEKGKKIVFTNGCFDLLHVGHISSFKKAKSFGDILIVAINSDDSVRENKGDLRPIINQEDRVEMISELECVDYVILMEDKTPVNLINYLKPDISIKGDDWKNKYVPEKEVIESYGGRIEFISLRDGKSTTKIIDKILKVYGKNE